MSAKKVTLGHRGLSPWWSRVRADAQAIERGSSAGSTSIEALIHKAVPALVT